MRSNRLHRLAAVCGAALVVCAAVAPFATSRADDEKSAAMAGDKPVLAGREGAYDTKVRFLVGGKEQGEATAGTAKVSAVVGGRFFLIDESGTMMGEPYTSWKLFGFNEDVGHHESTWIYTGSTATMRMSGDRAKDGSVKLAATFDAPQGEAMRFEIVFRAQDADRFTVEMIGLGDDGTPMMTEEVAYTRKK